jgi:hypothetical protein
MCNLIFGMNFLQNNNAIIDIEHSCLTLKRVKPLSIPFVINTTKEENNTSFSALIVSEKQLEEVIEEITDRQQFSEDQKVQVNKLFNEYRQLFDDKPGLTHLYTHEIEMRDKTPFYLRSYPIPKSFQQAVQNKIDEMVNLGIIRKAATPYVSPMLIIVKKDKTPRCCLDLRQLNRQIYLEH